MEFNFAEIGADLRHKLLCSFVGPRPIALVTTLSRDGVPNAAPMSFFNVIAQTPPLLILDLQDRAHGPKDTTRNVRETGELVVNLVDAPLARRMVACSIDHPPEVDETEVAGLTLLPSVSSNPAASPRPRSPSSAASSAPSTIPAAASCSPRSCTCTSATPASIALRCASGRRATAPSRGCTATGTSPPRTGPLRKPVL